MHHHWVTLQPNFQNDNEALSTFHGYARRLVDLLDTCDQDDNVEYQLKKLLESVVDGSRNVAVSAATNILNDLAHQKWSIRIGSRGKVEVKMPTHNHNDRDAEKARIRAQELVKRDEQLRETSTISFIKKMEKTTLRNGKPVSIYSVIRDGRELAKSLRSIRSLDSDHFVQELKTVISPYIQFVDEREYCEHTGIKLRDMWRYFRYTWTNQYTSAPGRSVAFIIRDKARENCPVIGIGSLGSPIVQIQERDSWIGWQFSEFVDFLHSISPSEVGKWFSQTIQKSIDEIYVNDFVEQMCVSPDAFKNPTVDICERLSEYGDKQRKLHRRLVDIKELKQRNHATTCIDDITSHWVSRATTYLFCSRRALLLADLLRCKIIIQSYLSSRPTTEEIGKLASTKDGAWSIRTILRRAKSERVGVAMADITVCGSVAPYNTILGGKLTSMMSVGPEVVLAYKKKYSVQESEIASSIAGRSIIRRSDLTFFGTTSLYGVGASQYNRLKMPADRLGGRHDEFIEYIRLGKSQAYGTSQFSSNTVKALTKLTQQTSNGRRVNSIFGEGVSPKLRKVRNGLDLLNLSPDILLQHGRQRIVYGIPVVRNLKRFLLGFDSEPEYIYDLKRPQEATQKIVNWWAQRWLHRRINSDEVLSQLEQHTLVHPIRHGARVMLPESDVHIGLFEDD